MAQVEKLLTSKSLHRQRDSILTVPLNAHTILSIHLHYHGQLNAYHLLPKLKFRDLVTEPETEIIGTCQIFMPLKQQIETLGYINYTSIF